MVTKVLISAPSSCTRMDGITGSRTRPLRPLCAGSSRHQPRRRRHDCCRRRCSCSTRSRVGRAASRRSIGCCAGGSSTPSLRSRTSLCITEMENPVGNRSCKLTNHTSSEANPKPSSASLGARARHNPSATLSPLSKPRPALLPTGHPIFLEFEHMRARAARPPLKRREAPFISTYPRPRSLHRVPQAA